MRTPRAVRDSNYSYIHRRAALRACCGRVCTFFLARWRAVRIHSAVQALQRTRSSTRTSTTCHAQPCSAHDSRKMNPADLALPALSPTLTAKTLPTPQSSAQKNGGKVPVPRVDLEPIYTQLKASLGDGWTDYKAAVNAFVLGAPCPCNA